ncbi:MAG: transcription termination factor NusA [Candidatus Omnitrophica bacterium]|nr:transcription termination factor NusA [Candidatus Omnitrophota bacterium]
MNGALLTALERIEREKGIDKEILFEAIESALASAAKKVIDDPGIEKEDITATVDRETGEIAIFLEGDEIENERFGRIAAQTAKQVMIQKIREAERDVIFEKYSKKVGVIISGSVHRFDKGNVIVELSDAEAVLPKSEQIPRERFRQGETIRAYLINVERGVSGPELILSRADGGFVKKLFELEVPEISQGIVEIKALAREAGERTKIAVCSKEEKVDPIGACVGMRGSRVRDIVKELNGERIDIVRWHDDIREYLPAAISPAEISRMAIDRENKIITLTVPKDQLSLLIGKKGRNIRLASKLIAWELIAESEEQTRAISLDEVPGIGAKKKEVLEEAEYDSVQKVYEAGLEKIAELVGIGPKTAEKIINACVEVLKMSEFGLPKKEKEDTPKDVILPFGPEKSDIEEQDKEESFDNEEVSSDEGEEKTEE